jgi:hypothetical protein
VFGELWEAWLTTATQTRATAKAQWVRSDEGSFLSWQHLEPRLDRIDPGDEPHAHINNIILRLAQRPATCQGRFTRTDHLWTGDRGVDEAMKVGQGATPSRTSGLLGRTRKRSLHSPVTPTLLGANVDRGGGQALVPEVGLQDILRHTLGR